MISSQLGTLGRLGALRPARLRPARGGLGRGAGGCGAADLASSPVAATCAGVGSAGSGEPGAADDVLARWRARLGASAWVLPRAEAIAAGWFGPVAPAVRERIGDVLAVMRTGTAVVNSARQRPEVLRLLGHHGALTPQEQLVPLFVTGP